LPGAYVELAAVTKRDDQTIAVDSVDLYVRAVTYYCLLGPSVYGESSTLRMSASQQRVTPGDIVRADNNITNLRPAGHRTAMMFQSYALFPHLNVRDNAAFSLKMRGEANAAGGHRDDRRARFRYPRQRAGSGWLQKRPPELSTQAVRTVEAMPDGCPGGHAKGV
jgi:putative spermidine/putrescine transport system ATP-binding protein